MKNTVIGQRTNYTLPIKSRIQTITTLKMLEVIGFKNHLDTTIEKFVDKYNPYRYTSIGLDLAKKQVYFTIDTDNSTTLDEFLNEIFFHVEKFQLSPEWFAEVDQTGVNVGCVFVPKDLLKNKYMTLVFNRNPNVST